MVLEKLGPHCLHRVVGYPIIPPRDRDDITRHVYNAWATAGSPTFDGDGGPQAADKVMQVSHEAESSTLSAVPPLHNPGGDEDASPYKVSRERQSQDPHLGLLISRMESATLSKRLRTATDRLWVLKRGLLYRLVIDITGEVAERPAVPQADRVALMRQFHHLCHRGGDPLHE